MNYTFARIIFWIGIVFILFGLFNYPILLGLFLIGFALLIISLLDKKDKELLTKYKKRHYDRR